MKAHNFILVAWQLFSQLLVVKAYYAMELNSKRVNTSNYVYFGNKEGTLNVQLANNVISYTTNLGVGSPPQFIEVVVDTGYPDLWVAGAYSVSSIFYNPSLSSTYNPSDMVFGVNNLKGFGTGLWIQENVVFGDILILNCTLGMMNQSFSTSQVQGVMGIAPMAAETRSPYPNMPQKLKNQGTIKSVSYSVFLNGPNETGGNMIFGGLDQTRYVGQLYSIPMPTPDKLEATLSRIRVNGMDQGWLAGHIPIDMGQSVCFLPPDVFIRIGAAIQGLHYYGGVFFADSLYFDGNQTIEFEFSGANMTIPVKNMLVSSSDLFLPTANIPKNYDLTLGIFPNSASGGQSYLGTTFMKSVYTVYDIEHGRIALAESNLNWTANLGSKIVSIDKHIPGAIPAPGLRHRRSRSGVSTIPLAKETGSPYSLKKRGLKKRSKKRMEAVKK